MKVRDLVQQITSLQKTVKTHPQLMLNHVVAHVANLSQSLLQDVQRDSPRIQRYKSYEGVAEAIPLISRALKVWRANILSPDDITKIILRYQPETKDILQDPIYKPTVRILNSLVRILDLENKLHDIVYDVLLYGDSFVEVATSKEIIDELVERRKVIKLKTNDSSYICSEIDFDITDLVDLYPVTEASVDGGQFTLTTKSGISSLLSLVRDEDEKDANKSEELVDFKELFMKSKDNALKLHEVGLILKVHKPADVVRLQVNELCLGFLVFTQNTENNAASGLGGLGNTSDQYEEIKTSLVQGIMEVIRRYLKRVTNIDLSVKHLLVLYKELDSYLSNITGANSVSVRYVPPDRMFHFRIDVNRFAPYGTSKLQDIMYTARLFLSMSTALAIYRVTRATEKRVFYVDIGSDNEVSRYIQDVVSTIRQNKFSLNNIEINAIPDAISTFEDIYVPMRDGKRFFEIDFVSGGDLATRADDVKEILKHLISGLGVPPPLLGIEEFTEAKATLVQENMSFAREVVDYQSMLSRELTRLLRSIFKKIYGKGNRLIDRIIVTFAPPRAIQIEFMSNVYQSISSILETLSNLDIPKEYVLRDLLTLIDWEDLDIFTVMTKLSQKSSGKRSKEKELDELQRFESEAK